MRLLSVVASITLLLLSAAPASAQSTHPDFSGKWSLDASKSEQSPVTPGSLDYSIEQHGAQMKVTRAIKTAEGESAATMTWSVDGKPWKNEWMQYGAPVAGVSTLTWEGATLVIKTALSAGGQEIAQTDRWTLAADRKTLTIDRAISVQGQDVSG